MAREMRESARRALQLEVLIQEALRTARMLMREVRGGGMVQALVIKMLVQWFTVIRQVQALGGCRLLKFEVAATTTSSADHAFPAHVRHRARFCCGE